jgi:hypothetical protein
LSTHKRHDRLGKNVLPIRGGGALKQGQRRSERIMSRCNRSREARH